MSEQEQKQAVEDQIGKARKHTGAPLSNVVGDQLDEDDATNGIGLGIALLLVDVINDIDFEGNDYMVQEAKKMAPKIKDLTQRCRDFDIPVIYCNDNFGKWRSNLQQIYERVTEVDSPGKPVAEMLKPQKDDYFVLKPKHSAFYATALDSLLTYLQVKTLIIVGMAGNVCILFTANDAYMRDFATFVPRDCIASSSPEEASAALLLMERVLRTNTIPSTELDLKHLVDLHKQTGLTNEDERKKRENAGGDSSSEPKGAEHKAKKQKASNLASDPGSAGDV